MTCFRESKTPYLMLLKDLLISNTATNSWCKSSSQLSVLLQILTRLPTLIWTVIFIKIKKKEPTQDSQQDFRVLNPQIGINNSLLISKVAITTKLNLRTSKRCRNRGLVQAREVKMSINKEKFNFKTNSNSKNRVLIVVNIRKKEMRIFLPN